MDMSGSLERMRPSGGSIEVGIDRDPRAGGLAIERGGAGKTDIDPGVRAAHRRPRPRPIHTVYSLACQKRERCS